MIWFSSAHVHSLDFHTTGVIIINIGRHLENWEERTHLSFGTTHAIVAIFVNLQLYIPLMTHWVVKANGKANNSILIYWRYFSWNCRKKFSEKRLGSDKAAARDFVEVSSLCTPKKIKSTSNAQSMRFSHYTTLDDRVHTQLCDPHIHKFPWRHRSEMPKMQNYNFSWNVPFDNQKFLAHTPSLSPFSANVGKWINRSRVVWNSTFS